MSTWEYRNATRTENEFAMYLAFDESLSIGALRAFVAATKHLDASDGVEIDQRPRHGHESVVAIIARRNSSELWPGDGPQPGDEPSGGAE